MRVFNLNLSERDIGVISAALMEMPYHSAAPVIDRINAQLKDIQDRAREEEAPPVS